MIAGIGTDIARTSRFERAYARQGDRFAKRILTDAEFTVFQQRNCSIAYLATRFAAKEAASKALGTGIGKVSFQDIEVVSAASGAPELRFYGAALDLQQKKGISTLHISLSDEKEYAQAFVILECSPASVLL